jgi:hypothetical protein
MLNGRYDFVKPLETCQEPMFRASGTPEPDKKHILYEKKPRLARSLSRPSKVMLIAPPRTHFNLEFLKSTAQAP